MLFGKKKQATGEIAFPTKPEGTPVVANGTQIGTYEALSKELGFKPAKLLQEQIFRFLAQENISTFSYAEVDAYLAAHAEKENLAWIWRPLRKVDEPDFIWAGRHSEKLSVNARFAHGSYHNSWNYRPYDKLVPIHILRQVKKIQDEFDTQVKFFVSDYAVPNPDPFIMVTALDVERIIFGIWDEPGFDTEK